MLIRLFAVLLVATGSIHLVLADRVVCPVVGSVSTEVIVDTTLDKFNEISGLAVSPTQLSENGNPIFFAHNDGGDGPRLGIFDSATGEHLLTLNVKGAVNQDWESMAMGPCGDSDNTCIYIGDTGDNTGRMSGGILSARGVNKYRIYKIREPTWDDHSSGDEIELDGVLKFDYASFPFSAFADSEALFVHPLGWGDDATAGDLYVVTKWNFFLSQTHNRIFYIPVSAWSLGGVYSPMALDPWFGDSVLMGNTFTSADMSPDGTLLVRGTYNDAYLFLRCPGTSIDNALEQGGSYFGPILLLVVKWRRSRGCLMAPARCRFRKDDNALRRGFITANVSHCAVRRTRNLPFFYRQQALPGFLVQSERNIIRRRGVSCPCTNFHFAAYSLRRIGH